MLGLTEAGEIDQKKLRQALVVKRRFNVSSTNKDLKNVVQRFHTLNPQVKSNTHQLAEKINEFTRKLESAFQKDVKYKTHKQKLAIRKLN
mmetsp:Transcript_31093/g.47480  ORF Transcript_31093/g.47480 Transcript_31093/m.47480 type:complete len:90 (-) Transcript_31093:2743-3012(-)